MCSCGKQNCLVDHGKCHCGCGADTPVAKKTIARLGHVKGQPRPWVRGHWAKMAETHEVDDSGCWIWQGAIDPVTGYGKWRRGYAHRRMFEEYIGPVPDGKELDHLCRVRECVNPEHLEPVAHRINARRGGQAKLTEGQVREIKRLRRNGVRNKDVAAMFGISRQNVSNITRGRAWAEVA